jgi:hypothetical protein
VIHFKHIELSMPKNPFFSLQQILYRLSGAATLEARQSLDDPEQQKPGRFPVTVRPETRAFLEAQANAWGGSIASVAGTILDGVAMIEIKGGESAMRGTTERLALVIEEHSLSYPAAAEVIDGSGITLGDLSSVEALRGKLTSRVLRDIAQRFVVNYDWLAGKADAMTEVGLHSWYKTATEAAEALWEAKNACSRVKLIVVTTVGADLDIKDYGDAFLNVPHFYPVLQKEKVLPGGELFVTYEIWDQGPWTHWRCRHYLKLLLYFAELANIHSIGKCLRSDEYESLYNGKVLPATMFKPHRHSSWHPDDYVPFRGGVPTKDAAEWHAIANDPEYASVFERFKEIVERERFLTRALEANS